MVVLVVLLASLVLFRGLGALGVEALSSWQGAAVWALAVMFLFTARHQGTCRSVPRPSGSGDVPGQRQRGGEGGARAREAAHAPVAEGPDAAVVRRSCLGGVAVVR
jgi:hypothetical protein